MNKSLYFKIKSLSKINNIVYYEDENGNLKVLPFGAHLKYKGAFGINEEIFSLFNFKQLEIPTHHVMYITNNKIIHFNGGQNSWDPREACIEYNTIDNLKNWANKNKSDIYCCIHTNKDQDSNIKKRYLPLVGSKKYNPLTDNCEHFVNYCITGEKKSLQADNFINGFINITNKFVNKKD